MIPMECINNSVNYYNTLLFYTLVPLAVAMLLLLANLLRGPKTNPAGDMTREGTKAYFNAFLLVTYLALVPVSTRIFYLLRCKEFVELDTSYLSLDMRLICRAGNHMTPSYSLMYCFALIMMLIYVRTRFIRENSSFDLGACPFLSLWAFRQCTRAFSGGLAKSSIQDSRTRMLVPGNYLSGILRG